MKHHQLLDERRRVFGLEVLHQRDVVLNPQLLLLQIDNMRRLLILQGLAVLLLDLLLQLLNEPKTWL